MTEEIYTRSESGLNRGFLLSRRLRLTSVPGKDDPVWEQLRALPGIQQIVLKGENMLGLRYDASKLHIDRILEVLQAAGLEIRRGWWSDMRLGWYRYVDGNAAVNAAQKEAHCCNKLPPGAG